MNRDFAADIVRPPLVAFGVAALACSSPAQAETGQGYVAGAATGSALDKPHQMIANAPAPGSTLRVVNDVDFGWGGQGEVGYAVRFLRIEAEVGYVSNHSGHYSAISPLSITLPQDGKNRVTRYMANAYLEPLRACWPVSPLSGAVSAPLMATSPPSPCRRVRHPRRAPRSSTSRIPASPGRRWAMSACR